MQKRRRERLVSKLLFTAAMLAVFAYVGVAYCYSPFFLFHTEINGVDVSLLPVEAAQERLDGALGNVRVTIRARGGEEAVFSGEELGLHYAFEDEVRAAKEGQDALGWLPAYCGVKSSYTVSPRAGYDPEKLKEAFAGTDFLEPRNMEPPVDASLTYTEEEGYVLTPSEEGTTVDMEKLEEALSAALADEEALREGSCVLDLEAEGCYEKPQVTEEDPAIRQVTEELDALADFTVTYTFGDTQEVLEGQAIWAFYRKDSHGELVLRESLVRDYVEALAEKYDTVGGTREFTTHGGKTVEVSGGPYGWKISVPKETEELLSLVENHESAVREPVYSQKGFGGQRQTSDIGDTYVEISIDEQHMWYYEDGELYMDTDVVTGNGGRHTKRGVGYIYNKARNVNLVGDDYVSFVRYWMKVWGGIGIHDASWRSSFGGKIYLTNGSHGCINTPIDNVIKLFERVEIGTPVVIY